MFFSDVRDSRSTVAIKGVFHTPSFVIVPESSANSWIRIELSCDASARERACMFIFCMGDTRCTSWRVCLRRGSGGASPLPFFSRGPSSRWRYLAGVLSRPPPSPLLHPAPLCLAGFACFCPCDLVGWPESGVGSSACHTDLACRTGGGVV